MTVAAIDIGTNSVRLLVLDESGRELAREMHITRLGQGVDETRRLHPDAIARTLDVLRGYAAQIAGLGASSLRVTGTSAVRDATNRNDLVRAVVELLGAEPEVLSGAEEAKLTFQGAVSSLQGCEAPYLVFDIGGGSTELVLGRDEPRHLVSLDVGCVRITERFGLDARPSTEQLRQAHGAVRALFEAVALTVPWQEANTWVGVAGTVTTFGALDARLGHYDPKVTHGRRLTRASFERLYEEVCSLSRPELELRLTEPRRASVILGGAIVLGEVFRHFDLESIVVSEHDILDGLAHSLQPA